MLCDPWYCPKCCLPSSIDDSCFSMNNVENYMGLRCRCLNARSIVNKRLDLQAVLDSEKLDILAVTETYLVIMRS